MQFQSARTDAVRGRDKQQVSGRPDRRADGDPVGRVVWMRPEQRAVIGIESENSLGAEKCYLRLAVDIDEQGRGIGVGKLERFPDHRAVALTERDGSVA